MSVRLTFDVSIKGTNCMQVQGHKFAIEKHAIWIIEKFNDAYRNSITDFYRNKTSIRSSNHRLILFANMLLVFFCAFISFYRVVTDSFRSHRMTNLQTRECNRIAILIFYKLWNAREAAWKY